MSNKIVDYFKESKAELKKVAWPTKKETTKHTLLVIGISLGLAAILGALDYIFSIGFENIINR
ncbi:MAG: preprotein translocase subunit SecE [Patescibacteria group bacterium]|jgi:preprotein translocase subunit SecE